MGRQERRNLIAGLLFVSPWLFGFLALTVYPIGASAYYSLTTYSVLSPGRFVGLGNYQQLLDQDNLFPISLRNTLAYAGMALPASLVIGISLALLLNLQVRGLSVYRAIYYMPTIVPAVASAGLWAWILNPQYGLVNSMLALVGVPGPGWLADPSWAKPALAIMSTWGAGQAVIIYLAGLQDIPQHLYEAAAIDGASSVQKTWYVTLPLLTPAIFFNLVIGLIGAFQYFTQVYILTQGLGGPLDSTLMYALYLYRSAFAYYKMGYASAMAWILFVIVVVITAIVFRSSGRWVHYQGGTR
jgi:multiple sugar transport system permease protein